MAQWQFHLNVPPASLIRAYIISKQNEYCACSSLPAYVVWKVQYTADAWLLHNSESRNIAKLVRPVLQGDFEFAWYSQFPEREFVSIQLLLKLFDRSNQLGLIVTNYCNQFPVLEAENRKFERRIIGIYSVIKVETLKTDEFIFK